MYQDITDQTGETGFRQRATAVGGGLLSAGLEAFGGESKMLQNLLRGGGVNSFRQAGKEIGKAAIESAIGEAGTEAGQEAIASLAPGVAGGQFPTIGEFASRVGEAGAAGGVTGGVMGGASRGVTAVGDVRPYAAALRDAVSPQPMQGINADGGLQPYTGQRLEVDDSPSRRINQNDVQSLATLQQMDTARGTPYQPPRDPNLQMLSRLSIDPQVTQSIYSIGQTLSAIEGGLEVDQSIKDDLLRQSGGISQFLGRIADSATRRNDPTGGINVVLDLQKRLDNWAKDTTAYNDLTAEAMAIGRESSSQQQGLMRQRGDASGVAGALGQLESDQSNRFGPGVRGEVRQTLSDAGTDIVQRLRQARLEDERQIAEAQARADAEAKARAAAETARIKAEADAKARSEAEAARVKAEAEAKALADAEVARAKISPPTESSLPADAGAAPVGGVPVAAPVLQSQIDSLQGFVDEVEEESANLPSPAKLASLAKKAQKLGHISQSDYNNIMVTQRSMGSRDDTVDAMGELESYLSIKLDDLKKSQRTEQAKPNVTQDQASQASPAPTVQPSKTKTPSRPEDAPTNKVKGVANANQIESPVALPSGNQPQGSAQDAGGSPNSLPISAGETQRNQPDGGSPTQKYKDGSDVKVGDYVRVNKLAGQTKIFGTVAEVRDGVPLVRISTIGKGQSGTAQSEKSGIRLGDTVAVSKKGVFLTKEVNKNELIEEKRKEKQTAKGAAKASKAEQAQEIINNGANDELFDEFFDLISKVSERNKEAQQKLLAFRERIGQEPGGKVRLIGLEAAARLRNMSQSLEMQAQAFASKYGAELLRNYNEERAAQYYLQAIQDWVLKSLKSDSDVRFSPSEIAMVALKNAMRKRAVDRLTSSMSSGTDLDGAETSPIEQIAATETGSAAAAAPVGTPSAQSTSAPSMFSLIKDLRKFADFIVNAVAIAEKKTGRQLTPSEFSDAVAVGVVDLVKSSSEASRVQELQSTIMSIGDQVSGDLQEYYDEGRTPAIREAIEDGTLSNSLNAAIDSIDTGNQSLPAGELTLEQAINTVLQTEPAGSLLRAIANKLLKAGVNARVIVLNDAAFDQLGARPGATAFYQSDPERNTIYVRQSAKSHDYLVMHEAIHAATVAALRTNVLFRNEIGRLRTQAIAALGNTSYGLQDHGSNFKNLSEFVAEALSSSEFQKALGGVKAGGQSLWDKFKALISKILGVSGKEKTLLDEVIERTSEQFSPNVATGNRSAGETLYAAPRISSDEKRQALLSVPGLQMDNVRAIENLAATQAQMIPASAIAMLGAASRRTQRRLAWIDRQANASASPSTISSLMSASPSYSEVEEIAELSHGVDKLARDIERNKERAEKRLEDLQTQFAGIGSMRAELAAEIGRAHV